MEGYEYEIFLSYPRFDKNWNRWTTEIFADVLKSVLWPRLGNVRIFIDENAEAGTSLPAEIAKKLSRSKIMVAVLSRGYFQRDWCRLEMAAMCIREKMLGYQSKDNPSGLIVPVTIDDGECFPCQVRDMKPIIMHDSKLVNPFMSKDSLSIESLSAFIAENICSHIENKLDAAPEFDPCWEEIDPTPHQETFSIESKSQSKAPSMKWKMP